MNQKITLTSVLNTTIQQIMDNNYNRDTCKPTFVISELLHGDKRDLILTLTHAGHSYSSYIDSDHDLEQKVTMLYNNTM